MATTLPHISGQENKLDPSQVSRTRLVAKMERVGINTAALESLTLPQLADLVYGFNKMANSSQPSARSSEKPQEGNMSVSLSVVDKKMLKMMLASERDVSSVTLSRELNVPLTTVQRRRKRLAGLIHSSYSLDWKKFGMRSMMFFIATESVAPSKIGSEMMSWPEVSSVTRMFSSNGFDLMVQVILKTNNEIIDFSEKVRSLTGVKEIFWNELIDVVGKNDDIRHLAVDAF